MEKAAVSLVSGAKAAGISVGADRGEQRNERRRREKCDAAASVIVVLQHREELYGKLLRAGGAAAVDLKSRLMGLGGEDCFL